MSYYRGEGGQSMILMVIMLSTISLGTMALAVFLIVSGFRNISGANQSMEAIFAADSGIECVIYKEFGHANFSDMKEICPQVNEEVKIAKNGASFSFNYKGELPPLGCKNWYSYGSDSRNNSTRSLSICFVKKI